MSIAWDDFRLVKAIADRGGLTAAAAELGINHSTAFRRLTAIETTLETRLFERLRSGYRPTPAGAAMIAVADRIADEVTDFSRALAGTAQAVSGDLRVTCPANFVAGLMMPLLGRFRERYPAVRVELLVSEDTLNLSRRDADVALRASNRPAPVLVGRRLSGIAWAVYGRVEDGPEIAERDWVVPDKGVSGGRFLPFALEHAPIERIALRVNTVLGLTEAVEAGIGIGPLPCWNGDASARLCRLTPPAPELESSLWLLTHPDLRHAGRVRAFLDFCSDEIGPMRAALEGRKAR